MNQVTFAGNATADVTSKEYGNKKQVAEFSVAINRKYKNEAGEEVKEVSFIEVKAFGWACHQAKQVKKGDYVIVNGSLKQDRWEDATTKQNRSKLYIVAFAIGIIPKTGPQTQGEQSSGDTVPF